MTILDLLYSRGIKPRRVAATKGGEYHSACPRCGGSDRFHCWPAQGQGGTWWCRGCDHAGDQIEFLRHVDNLGFQEACARLGLERSTDFRAMPKPARRHQEESFSGVPRELPPAQWCEKAEKLVSEAKAALFSPAGDKALLWLERRGIGPAAAAAYRLGWLEGYRDKNCRWRPRSAWGLQDLEFEKEGVKKLRRKLWIPRGLVIPTLRNGLPVALRVRRPAADLTDSQTKYVAVSGSAMKPFMATGRRPAAPGAWVIAESQLDAIMISEQVSSQHPPLPVGAMAMLSNTGKPCPETHQVLAASNKILVALDYDQAGKKGWEWWEKTYRQAVRWPALEGKDPGEYFALGGDIYEWIREGLS